MMLLYIVSEFKVVASQRCRNIEKRIYECRRSLGSGAQTQSMPHEARRSRQTRGRQQASICREECQGRLESLYIHFETTSEDRAAFAPFERCILIARGSAVKVNESLKASES